MADWLPASAPAGNFRDHNKYEPVVCVAFGSSELPCDFRCDRHELRRWQNAQDPQRRSVESPSPDIANQVDDDLRVGHQPARIRQQAQSIQRIAICSMSIQGYQ